MADSARSTEEKHRATPSPATPDAEKSNGAVLCDDIVSNILARLPLRTAVACTLLSKHHRRLIRSPEFRTLHFRLAPQLPRPHIACVATAPITRRPDQEEDPVVSGFVAFHLAAGGGLISGGVTPMRSLAGRRYIDMEYVNTCNGVVLLASEAHTAKWRQRRRRHRCILWNPAVADAVEEVAVPEPPAGSDYLTLGLGYGPRSKTYKLLLCHIDVSSHGRTVKSLLTFPLGGNMQKQQPRELPVGTEVTISIQNSSLYMDGRIYVLESDGRAIMAFDVDDETVTSIDLPVELDRHGIWSYTPTLMELYGRPCVAADYYGGVTLWMLSADHQWDRWCLLEEVDENFCGSVKGVWDCGGVLVLNLENKCHGGVDYLFLYDGETEEMFKATLHRDVAPEWDESCVNPRLCWGYLPTLVSPGSVVGKLELEDEDTCCSRNIMKALRPVTEQDKRKGLEVTMDVMCFVDFLARVMEKLPDGLQQVVEMKLTGLDDPAISFERVVFADEDF